MDEEKQNLLDQSKILTTKIEEYISKEKEKYASEARLVDFEIKSSLEKMHLASKKMYALGPGGQTCPTCGGLGRILL